MHLNEQYLSILSRVRFSKMHLVILQSHTRLHNWWVWFSKMHLAILLNHTLLHIWGVWFSKMHMVMLLRKTPRRDRWTPTQNVVNPPPLWSPLTQALPYPHLGEWLSKMLMVILLNHTLPAGGYDLARCTWPFYLIIPCGRGMIQ